MIQTLPKYSFMYILYRVSLLKVEHGDGVGARITRSQNAIHGDSYRTANGRPYIGFFFVPVW